MTVIIIIIIIISKFLKHHVCPQKAAEALVRYRSDCLVTAIKQECLKMSFKTMFRIAQHDFCRQELSYYYYYYYVTNVWRKTSLFSVRFFCYRYLGDGGTDWRAILHDGTYMSRICLLSFWGRCPRDLQIRNLPTPVWLVLCFANALDFVALVDARGNYVLNGNFIVSAFHKELHVSGTILEYSGSGTIVERINGTGVIYEDIYVHVRLC